MFNKTFDMFNKTFDMFDKIFINENYKILLDSSAECACDLHVIIM